ncbi:hypothetical protein ARMGADRAFT_1033758 [Armillaria gallica]|uniref:Uncharacterized protein n=1 Tax=Armillaria gallica TaxID=47427 RepID=A0A2H3D3V0_ARMGA|nr:hypothetical protein ARMGADRAFT_1033758 [Armillaria gallica]
MKHHYAKKVGNPIPRTKKIKLALIPEVPPTQGHVLKLIQKLRLANGTLLALTNNSVLSYIVKLCTSARRSSSQDAANELVDAELTRVQGILDDGLAAHGAIYTEMGICTEWKEGDVIVKQIQQVVSYLEDISCHILEQDLGVAWEGNTCEAPGSQDTGPELREHLRTTVQYFLWLRQSFNYLFTGCTLFSLYSAATEPLTRGCLAEREKPIWSLHWLIDGWVPALKHEKAKADVILMQISPLVEHLHLTYVDWYPPEFDKADLD